MDMKDLKKKIIPLLMISTVLMTGCFKNYDDIDVSLEDNGENVFVPGASDSESDGAIETDVRPVNEFEKYYYIKKDTIQYSNRLFLPERSGPHPVVIFSPEAGNLGKDYYELARKFTANGVAVFIPEPNIERENVDDFFSNQVDQIDKLINLVKEIPELDSSKILTSGWGFGAYESMVAVAKDPSRVTGAFYYNPDLDFAEDAALKFGNSESIPEDNEMNIPPEIIKDMNSVDYKTVLTSNTEKMIIFRNDFQDEAFKTQYEALTALIPNCIEDELPQSGYNFRIFMRGGDQGDMLDKALSFINEANMK